MEFFWSCDRPLESNLRKNIGLINIACVRQQGDVLLISKSNLKDDIG